MARGDIVTIANGAVALRPLADKAQSIVVNNPNNGNVYVAADELPTTLFFDYIVRPNTTARLPGLFRETVGLLYQDLSGAGSSGQVEWFRSDRVVDAPEYGPIGSATQTSFSNVDLAQVATPSPPANGFSRLFASAVDQQLWYELPSGVLVPVSQQCKLQLNSVAAVDLSGSGGTGIVANTWTALSSNVSFSVDDASSVIEVAVSGNCYGVFYTGACYLSSRIAIDYQQNTVLAKLGGAPQTPNSASNFLSGGGAAFFTGLSAGVHNVQVQLFSNAAGTFYCRPSSQPDIEHFAIRVMEYKR